MALIKCPECGKEISNRAASCPQCGISMKDIQTKMQRLKTDKVSDDKGDSDSRSQPKECPSDLRIVDNVRNSTPLKRRKWFWYVVMALVLLIIAGVVVVPRLSSDTPVAKERTLEEIKREAEKFKRELPESYVVLGECIDSLVQKVYYTNRVSPWDDVNELWQSYIDDFNYIKDTRYSRKKLELIAKDTSDTFIKVYNLQTGDTSDIDLSRASSEYGRFDDYQCGIRFSHYAKGRLYFSVPESRYGGNIYCINVYTDEVSKIVDGGCVTNIRVEGDKLVYTNSIVANENEAECTADYDWVTQDFSFDF